MGAAIVHKGRSKRQRGVEGISSWLSGAAEASTEGVILLVKNNQVHHEEMFHLDQSLSMKAIDSGRWMLESTSLPPFPGV